MNALLISMVLVATAVNGQVSVQGGLSEHDCAEAQCQLQNGQSCEAEAEVVTKGRAALIAYMKANPKVKTQCNLDLCMDRSGAEWTQGYSRTVSPWEIQSAECVK